MPMTKKALIVIAILILIPIIIMLNAVSKFNKANTVVAEYGGNVDIIEYEGIELHRVKSEFEYRFRFGEYLGKVGDSLTGAPFYRVADDETGSYYAIAEGGKKFLYTESGELADGVRKNESVTTRVIFDDFLIVEEDAENIALIEGLSGKKVSVDMSQYASYDTYDLFFALDHSAIVTEYFGKLIYLTEREDWIFVSPEELDAAVEEYGDDPEEYVYIALLISDDDLEELLTSYFDETPDTEAEES